MSSVILVGFMGVGKTTVGRILADRLGRRFVDLDVEIEGALGTTVGEIFRCHGEAAFRTAERAALERVLHGPPSVIAAGGGAWCDPANREAARASAAVAVFLEPPWSTVWARLAADAGDRPKLLDHDRTRALYDARLPDYRRADLTLEVAGDEPPELVADRIRSALSEVACGT